MISKEQLDKCINILAELNARMTSTKDKTLLLEIGYIIKQELDNVTAWEEAHPRSGSFKQVDTNKLLEDNIQLCRENQTLIQSVNELKTMFEKALPSVQTRLQLIGEKFDTLNENINRL